jgi:hypothetical protein
MTVPIPFKRIYVPHLPGDRVTGTASTGTKITGPIVEYLAHVVDERGDGTNGYFRSADLKAAPRLERRSLPIRRVWQIQDIDCPARRTTRWTSGRRKTDTLWENYTNPPDRRIAKTPRRVWESKKIGHLRRRTGVGAGRRSTDTPGDKYYYQDRRIAKTPRRVWQVLPAPTRRNQTAGRREFDNIPTNPSFSFYYQERRKSQRRVKIYGRLSTLRRNSTGRRWTDPKNGWHNGHGYYYQ